MTKLSLPPEVFRAMVGCPVSVAEQWAPLLSAAMDAFGIQEPLVVAGFIAQIAHESGGFTRFSENLNYSARGLASTWPSRFAVNPKARVREPNALAVQVQRQPERIANLVYANRMGNGSPETGDGWRYRGRGPKQITGKNNYSRLSDKLGVDLVKHPDLLLDPRYGALAAAAYWTVVGCTPLMRSGQYEAVTKAINGGVIGHEDGNNLGLDDRVEWLAQCKKVMGLA